MKRSLFTILLVVPVFTIQPLFSNDQSEIMVIKKFPMAAQETPPLIFSIGFDSPEDAARSYPPGYRIAPGDSSGTGSGTTNAVRQ